jgi:hypothetical protein
VESKPSLSLIPIPANHTRTIKTIVVPYFITIYMADPNATDPWRPLAAKDFDTLEDLCHRACGEPLGHKIDENSEIVKLVGTFILLIKHPCANVDID